MEEGSAAQTQADEVQTQADEVQTQTDTATGITA